MTTRNDIVIGITDCGSYANYERWIQAEAGIRTIRLNYNEDSLRELKRCDGVILSGGEDVHPRFYNKPEYLPYCGDIVEARDEFEFAVLEHTEKNRVPVLGICRGLQVANVFFGGTLVPDLPSFAKFNHSKFPNEDRYHDIMVDPRSELSKLTGLNIGSVNSAHHQSAEWIGKGLVVNCFSPDGVVEGIERKNADSTAYLMLVQWHPERMTDQTNPFTRKIKQSFLDALKK